MGIPRLNPGLRPYGKVTILDGQSVVIDGPALVHRVWELVMSPESAESAALCHVSYATLGQSFINWLDRLRAGNVNV